MIEKISLKALDEMVDYISELENLYRKQEDEECIFNPLIFLKMLTLPFYEDKEIVVKEKLLSKLVETTPCSDKLKFYQEQFLVFYKDWLNKHYPDVYKRLDKIKLFKVNEFFEIDSENRIKLEAKEIIDAKTFMDNSDIDEKLILDLIRSIKKMKTISSNYSQLTPEYVEELFLNDEFIQVFQFSIEFREIAYALELLKLKLLSLELENLSSQQKVILKTMMDGILADLDDWTHKVLIDQTARDIHYLDASLLANIEQMDIILKSLEERESQMEFF